MGIILNCYYHHHPLFPPVNNLAFGGSFRVFYLFQFYFSHGPYLFEVSLVFPLKIKRINERVDRKMCMRKGTSKQVKKKSCNKKKKLKDSTLPPPLIVSLIAALAFLLMCIKWWFVNALAKSAFVDAVVSASVGYC